MFFSILGQIITGWLIADMLSGIFHWWQDRWPHVSNRWIGNYLIAPSRLHHLKPGEFLHYDFLYRNSATFVGVSVFSIPLFVIFGINLTLVSAVVGGLITTQVHYLAHCPVRANKWGKMLQATGIIQSPAHHSQHHRSPNCTRYCILTNFVNPLLDELDIWNRLETLLTKMNVKLSLGKE